jgi:hypothetical protein
LIPPFLIAFLGFLGSITQAFKRLIKSFANNVLQVLQVLLFFAFKQNL